VFCGMCVPTYTWLFESRGKFNIRQNLSSTSSRLTSKRWRFHYITSRITVFHFSMNLPKTIILPLLWSDLVISSLIDQASKVQFREKNPKTFLSEKNQLWSAHQLFIECHRKYGNGYMHTYKAPIFLSEAQPYVPSRMHLSTHSL
jgi:hypothetical protein